MHLMRGTRVRPLSEIEIKAIAVNACFALGFTSKYKYRRRPRRFDVALETLSQWNIVLDQWMMTNGSEKRWVLRLDTVNLTN